MGTEIAPFSLATPRWRRQTDACDLHLAPVNGDESAAGYSAVDFRTGIAQWMRVRDVDGRLSIGPVVVKHFRRSRQPPCAVAVDYRKVQEQDGRRQCRSGYRTYKEFGQVSLPAPPPGSATRSLPSRKSTTAQIEPLGIDAPTSKVTMPVPD